MTGRGRKRGTEDDDNGWAAWGGYMTAKVQKLENQYKVDFSKQAETPSTALSSIFKGIGIYVNGYTVPPADELRRLMMLHGGIYYHYYRKSHTTHIVATSLALVKIKDLTTERIMRPEWITDSITANRLLPDRDYQLFRQASKYQKRLAFESVDTDKSAVSSNVAINTTEAGEEVPSTSNCVTGNFKNLGMTELEPSNELFFNHPREASTAVTANGDTNRASSSTTSHSAMCATNSNFLSEFYSHSRLHHISTMGAEFRNYVHQLRSSSDGTFPGRIRIKAWKARQRLARGKSSASSPVSTLPTNADQTTVMHIDMDCFFVSVGLRDRPELKGIPVAVTHSRGIGSANQQNASVVQIEKEYYKKRRMRNSRSSANSISVSASNELIEDDELDTAASSKLSSEFISLSEVASCSYEARQAGVHNGMMLGEAKKLCPNLQTIPYNFEGYHEVAHILYNTIASYTHDIEAVSCDELFVDCTDILKTMQIGPLDLATIIRHEIKEKTRCSCSAGLASNKLLARMVTRKAKPDGQYFLSLDEVDEFMKPQLVTSLPGVGWSLGTRLKELQVETCEDLTKIPLITLKNGLGPRMGQVLYNYCRGIDDRQVKPEHQRKSVSAEVNYGIRFTQDSEVFEFIQKLSEEVAQRLVNAGMNGKLLTLKLKVRKKDAPTETSKFMGHSICDNLTRSISLVHPTSDGKVVAREVMGMLNCMRVPPHEMRGIGIQVQRLEPIVKNFSNGTILKFLKQTKENDTLSSDKEEASTCTAEPAVYESEDSSNQFATETATKNHDEFEATLPPPSQIDFEVLSALPPELQDQILAEYKRQGIDFSGPSAIAGPSGYKANQDAETAIDDCDIPDIRGSSVDPTFYRALPPEIQEEIKEMLQREKQESPSKPRLPPLPQTPQKQLRTPPKAARGGRKQKAGSGKKHSPIREKIDRQQPKLHEMLANNKRPNKTDAVLEQPPTVTTDTTSKSEPEKANLCGATELSRVKSLIQEWINTCPEPEDDDIDTLIRYLKQLVLEKNLETADLVIKYFNRVVWKTGRNQWKTAYCQITNDVQKLMVHLYKAPLKLPCNAS